MFWDPKVLFCLQRPRMLFRGGHESGPDVFRIYSCRCSRECWFSGRHSPEKMIPHSFLEPEY